MLLELIIRLIKIFPCIDLCLGRTASAPHSRSQFTALRIAFEFRHFLANIQTLFHTNNTFPRIFCDFFNLYVAIKHLPPPENALLLSIQIQINYQKGNIMRHYEQIASVLHFRVFFKTFFDCLAVNPCFYALKTMSDIIQTRSDII